MSVKINFPKSGMGIEEGTVVRWLKGVGERIDRGEVLVEIETEKALQEVLAPESGTLAEVHARDGEIVAVNTSLGVIET
jgi:pyruvate/2-oxoglutarate dehydrogenase complex dihydrolipoamide acyltransferase (E2) component